jgi:hypothetical protein
MLENPYQPPEEGSKVIRWLDAALFTILALVVVAAIAWLLVHSTESRKVPGLPLPASGQ